MAVKKLQSAWIHATSKEMCFYTEKKSSEVLTGTYKTSLAKDLNYNTHILLVKDSIKLALKHTPGDATIFHTLTWCSALFWKTTRPFFRKVKSNRAHKNHGRHFMCVFVHLCSFLLFFLRLMFFMLLMHDSHLHTLLWCVKCESVVWFDVYKAVQQKAPLRMSRS